MVATLGRAALYAQRHPKAAARMATVQAETREVIAQALSHGRQPVSAELATVVHALWSGFMHYRLTSSNAISAACCWAWRDRRKP